MTTTAFNLPTAEEMTDRLRTWAERYRVPGATVAWMHGDEVQSAATGVINIETGVETTPDTLFQIGSITKVYTTTLIMQLVDEGRIDLDAPATTYLPGLRFSDDAATRTVTIRHLLTHTSGVDGDFFDDFGRGDDCVAKYVAACADLPQVFAPGAMFSYCNAGFVVLGRIIELMTGMGWDEALRERLLKPLGVTHTRDAARTGAAAIAPPPATSSMSSSTSTCRRCWGMARAAGPAGATPCATVADLLTFARMHIDGGVARDGTRVLSEASVRAMQQVQFDLPAQPGEGADHWGLGWMLFDWGGRRIIGHDGGTIGQNSSLRVLPEERFAVAVLANGTSGVLLAGRIMSWLFGQSLGIEMPERPRPPEPAVQIDLKPYIGVYEQLGLRREVEEHEGRLTMRVVNTGPLAGVMPQLPPSDLIAVEPGLFLERSPIGRFVPVTFSGGDDQGRAPYLYATRVARRVG